MHPHVPSTILTLPLHPIFRSPMKNSMFHDTFNLISTHTQRIEIRESAVPVLIITKIYIPLLEEFQSPNIDLIGCFAEGLWQIQSTSCTFDIPHPIRSEPSGRPLPRNLMRHVGSIHPHHVPNLNLRRHTPSHQGNTQSHLCCQIVI